jgi:phosphoglycolate phosphatase
MKKEIETIIFDFDGVIANSLDQVIYVLKEYSKSYMLDVYYKLLKLYFKVKPKAIRERILKPMAKRVIYAARTVRDQHIDRNLFRNLGILGFVKHLKFPKILIPFLVFRLRKAYNQRSDYIDPFEDIPELLKQLSQDYKLYILSTNSKDFIHNFLNKYNLTKYFDKVFTEDTIFKKEKALEKIIKEENIDKNKAVYIGDGTRDINSCKAINLPIIAATWGYEAKDLLEKAEPDYIAEKPEEVANLVR